MATWSPELLLIRPIRGETDSTPETGRDVLWAPGRRSPQMLIKDQFPFSKFSPILQQVFSKCKELGTVQKLLGLRKGAGYVFLVFAFLLRVIYICWEGRGRSFIIFSPMNYVFFIHSGAKISQFLKSISNKRAGLYFPCFDLFAILF